MGEACRQYGGMANCSDQLGRVDSLLSGSLYQAQGPDREVTRETTTFHVTD